MEIFNHIKKGEHKTLFAFINTYNPVIEKDIFFVEYTNDKCDMLLDDSKYLSGLYLKKRNGVDVLEDTDNLIKNIQYVKRYYSFVQIIEDEDADLIGKTMIVFYGRTIKEKIEKHINENKRFNNLFRYIRSKTNTAFPTYDNSYFTDDVYQLNDYSLDINNHIKFKTVVLPHVLLRKDKILKIKERMKC